MAFEQKVGSATKKETKEPVESLKPSMIELDANGDDDDLALKMDEDCDEEVDSKQNVLKSKLKLKIGNNQIDDEEEDDDKEDDDEGDDDDEEEEEDDDEEDDSKQNALKSKSKQKIKINTNSQQIKNKTTLKKKDDSDEFLKKQIEKNLAIAQQNKKLEDKRDARQLIVRNLPVDITCEELKSLSDDIIHVILPDPYTVKRRNYKTVFAFVEFVNEKKAEENFAVFESQKLRGVPIEYDYAGVKGKIPRTTDFALTNYCAKKLIVTSLPVDVKITQIAELTPSATSIASTNSSVNRIRMAFVNFDSEEAAAEAFEANKEAKINGIPVLFLYAKSNTRPFKRHFLKERKDMDKQSAKRPKQDLDASSQD